MTIVETVYQEDQPLTLREAEVEYHNRTSLGDCVRHEADTSTFLY